MFIDQIAGLEEFLSNNKMYETLSILRMELAARIKTTEPSQQLINLLNRPTKPSKQNQVVKQNLSIKKQIPDMKKKKSEMLVQGLLGKIAYSSKILEDQKINDQINKLMENKIFQAAVGKMFPETQTLKNDQPEEQISAIQAHHDDASILSQPSYVLEELNKQQQQDEYLDDGDLGYHQFDFEQNQLMNGCAKLTSKYGYPECAIKKSGKAPEKKSKKKPTGSKFDSQIIFPTSEDKIYPLEYNGFIYDSMKIQVIYNRERTGYEDTKQPQFKSGDVIAGKYEVLSIMGNGVFAKVLKVKEINNGQLSCLKMIANNKDFVDQSLDQIKLLRLVKANFDPSTQYLLQFKSVFYHRQHLFIETDLLKDNLFIAYRKNPSYFSIPTIKIISKQILTAISTLHSLKIIHSDLKPENILIKSYNPPEIKVIDLGNSCFSHDNLGFYVQSRSYRAPEVILGAGYDQKIDIWSVGCIIAELWTKNVLFYNLHVAGMLARIQSIMGPWPEWMLQTGGQVSSFFSKQNLIFYEEKGKYHILIPKKSSLKHRIRTDDMQFLSFINMLLELDPSKRCSAQEALKHQFLQ